MRFIRGVAPLTPPLFCDDRKGGKSVFFSLSQIKETKEMLFRHAFRNPPWIVLRRLRIIVTDKMLYLILLVGESWFVVENRMCGGFVSMLSLQICWKLKRNKANDNEWACRRYYRRKGRADYIKTFLSTLSPISLAREIGWGSRGNAPKTVHHLLIDGFSASPNPFALPK